MLNRSFKPAKCKTALKLATSRLKLMKNKKLVQINQMKRELSQLLETGQDRTARIRVEHVIREEKMVAAYDLIEIYCELIVARLPIIESQKSCPIDLKEAVTSVIYASPRCSDIPELQDARKHFTTKYGKVFISAAIDLVPNCGVGRMLIEKLSVAAPDVQTKIKVLSAVAEEYNVKWDPNAFEEKESKAPDDLLNGPNTFEKASVTHAHEQGRNEPLNYSQQNSRSSLGAGNYASTNTGGIQTSSSASLADARASGTGPERMEVRDSFPKDGNDNSYDRKNWNMEFTDATAAAQAAAESAERASMAARAAAELSRQERRSGEYSTDAQKSSYREEEPRRYGASGSPAEHYSRGSYNNSFSDRKPKVQDQQMGRSEIEEKAAERFNEDGYARRSGPYSTDSQKSSLREQEPRRYGASDSPAEHYSRGSYNNSFSDKKPKAQDQRISRSEIEEKAAERFDEDGYGRRSSRTASLRSRNDSVHDDNSVNNEQKRYSQESSFQEKIDKAEKDTTSSPEMSIRERTRRASNAELDNRRHDSFKSDNYSYHGKEMNRNQSRTSSSRSHSMNLSDKNNVPGSDRRKIGNDSAEDRSVVDHGNIYKEPTKTTIYDDVADDVTSDESESDEDGPRFDSGLQFDEVDAKSFFPSPDRESPIHSFERTNSLSPKRTMVKSVEKTGFEPDNLVSAAFDPSDGTVFDNEDEPYHKRMNEQRLYMESPKKGKSRLELSNLSDKSPERSPTAKPMPTPIIKSSINSSVSRAEHKESSVSQTASGSDFNYLSFKSTQEETKKSRFEPPRFFDHDDDDSESDRPKGNSSSRVNLGTRLSRRTKAAPSTSGASTSLKSQVEPDTNPVNSASVETPLETRSHARKFKEETSKPIPEPKISRREESFKSQAAEQPSSAQSYVGLQASPKKQVEPDTTPVNSGSVTGRKPSRPSYSDETPHSRKFNQETSKPIPEIKVPRREESFKSQTAEKPSSGRSYVGLQTHSANLRTEATREKPESKREESLKSQGAEQPSSPQRKRAESSVPKLEKASSSGGGTSTEENTVKKPSHVHPKLPDYEDIAARLQALRMNR